MPNRPGVEEFRSEHRFSWGIDEVIAHRDLVAVLAKREIAGAYQTSLFGIFWRFLPPAFALAGYSLIFGFFGRVQMSSDHPYVVQLFCGLFPWTIFSTALLGASNSILANAGLIKKIYFPRLIAPVISMTDKFIDIAVGLVIFVVLQSFFGLPIGINIIGMLWVAVLSLLLGFALGLWLSWIVVLVRDIGHVLPMAVQVGFYLSPIVYSTQSVPYPYRIIYDLNPMVAIIDMSRWVALGIGEITAMSIATTIALIAVLIAGGLLFFRRAERILVDIL